ncbi:hypothetical protein Gpo141_00011572 [Globisporangium polare]
MPPASDAAHLFQETARADGGEQQRDQHPPPYAPPVPAPADSEEAAALARAIEGSAFSTWKESLAAELESETSALKARVHDLQSEFDDASVFIRGDLAWRKQLGTFHDKVNDLLHLQMESMVAKLKQNADLLSQSITESFARKDEQAKLAMEWQVKMYEDKLRRTRTSLKKEIDRFTHLEKCLRKEEAFQAKEMYGDLVLQLASEHAAKEASLHALLRELRSSYNAMELGNTHLMDSLKATRSESERMKKMLIKQTSSVGGGGGSPRKSSVRSPSRFASMSTTAAASSIPDVYVQSLKQSLSTAAQALDGLKKQVAELTSDKESSMKRARQAEDATSRVSDELARVTQLLSESHSALIASKKATEQVESERTHWKELFAELHFRTGSNDQEIEAAKQLADATMEYIASLEQQVERLARLGLFTGVMEGAFAEWLDQDPGERDLQALQSIVEAFFSKCSSGDTTAGDPEGDLDCDIGGRERPELESKLRYEYEKRYGNQLNLRVSHERKRVLARIEMLCASHNKSEASASIGTTGGMGSTTRQQLKPRTTGRASKLSKIPFRVVHKIVSDVYDHLGFSEWSATDLDFLHNQIETLQTQIAQQKLETQGIEKFAEAQGVALAKADLLRQEKEFLLAQLTDKYRELRAAQDATLQQQPPTDNLESESSSDPVRFGEVPLTVYGHPQRLELKKLRSRPVSASPCLVSSQPELDGERERDESAAHPQHQSVLPTSQKQQPYNKQTRPVSSAGPLSQHRIKPTKGPGIERWSRSRASADSPHTKPFLSANGAFGAARTTEPQQQVEHIRSVLKTELLQLSPPESQLEDGGHLGPDGILQIIQRRRNRK